MIVGHYAPALVAKAAEPRLPLAALFVAVQLVDVAWALLVLAGVERVAIVPSLPGNPLDLFYMPFTHSLPATAGWTAATYLGTRRWLGGRPAAVLAAAVASHWLGDLLVHRPDLPLGWTGPKVGLGLWNLPAASYVVEVGLLLGSLWWCWRNAAVARPRLLALLVGVLALFETAGRALPPPATPAAVASLGLGAFAAIAVAGAWVDRRR